MTLRRWRIHGHLEPLAGRRVILHSTSVEPGLDTGTVRLSSCKSKLYDPEGHETSQNQLRNFSIVWQLLRDLTRDNPQITLLLKRLAGAGLALITSLSTRTDSPATTPREIFSRSANGHSPSNTKAAIAATRQAVASMCGLDGTQVCKDHARRQA